MKKRLFNFDIWWALAFIVTEGAMLGIAVSALIEANNKTGPAIAIALLIAAAVGIVWLFVFAVPTVTDSAIRYKNKMITKENAAARVEFNERFNEMEIIIKPIDECVRNERKQCIHGYSRHALKNSIAPKAFHFTTKKTLSSG